MLVSTPNRNYTVNDYEQFFIDLNHQDGYEMRLNTKDLIIELNPPEVEIHTIYGTGLKTPESFSWDKVTV